MLCPRCHVQNENDALTCASCGAPLSFAAAAIDTPPLARLRDRALAVLVDMIVICAAYVVIGSWVAGRWGGLTAQGFSLQGRPALIAVGITLLVGFLYYWLLEATTGATIGKAIAGIRVRGASREAVGIGPSLIRNVARIIDAVAVYLVGFLIARFSKRRQRLGDHLAHTIVVPRSAARAGRMLAVAMLLLVVVASGFSTMAVRRAASAQASSGAREASAGEAPASDASAGPLRLEHLRWVGSEGGAARPDAPYHPGDNVYASYELLGSKTDSLKRNDVTLRLSVIDPSGTPLALPWQVDVKAVNSSHLPITGNFHVHLPPFVPPGTYTLRVLAHDAVASKDSSFGPTFVVDGPPIAPATALEVRDLRLAATESGEALTPPVFQPGQTVYFALRLFGVQFRDDRPDLHVDMRLLSPKGEVLLSKSDWIAERDSLGYHPAFMFYPLSSFVTLPTGIPKGSYTQEFVIRDDVANARLTFPAKFEVR